MRVQVAEYERIAVPLALEALFLDAPALAHAVSLRAPTGMPICLVTVVGPGPHPSGLIGPAQEAALQDLADQARARFGVPFQSEVLREADPAATCNDALERYFAAHDIELVIMSSHRPRLSDHWLPAHGQWLAAHSARSLLLLR